MQADHLSSCGWPMLSSFLPVCHMVYWNSIILNCGLLVLNVAWRAIYIWVSIWEYACSYCSVQPLFVYMCLFKSLWWVMTELVSGRQEIWTVISLDPTDLAILWLILSWRGVLWFQNLFLEHFYICSCPL